MFKKFAIFFLLFFLSLSFVKPLLAESNQVTVYLFWSQSCPHCAQEKVFLEKLEEKYEGVEIKDFEISHHQENLVLLQKLGQRINVSTGQIPFTVVGEEYFVGYLNDQTTGQEIERAVNRALEEGSPDIVNDLVAPKEATKAIPDIFELPFLGELKTKNLSLPALTLVIALLDGFNPCAMWALLFLISLLLGMKDRKRMWALGATFILASGVVYFLFLSAWLNFFLFLGFILWVRILIGLIALAAGSFNLRDFWVNREGGCEIVKGKTRREMIFKKIRKITQKKEFLLALGGMVLLAFAVNLVELVCSAGLPAIYTQILSLTKLPQWQYYLYLIFYILIFMLDDLVVFLVAMITLQAIGIQAKYARYSKLIGGLLMLAIGLLLLFKPEWLMFS